MFSMRTLILLGAAIYLLPSDPNRQQQFAATASQAYQKVTTICERDPRICEKAGVVYEDLKAKAHFGFGVVYALATGKAQSRDAAEDISYVSESYVPENARAERIGRNSTLTPSDLAPVWRGSLQSFEKIRYNR
jgi:hypothetical protein